MAPATHRIQSCLRLLLVLMGWQLQGANTERQAEADAFFDGPILRWNLRLPDSSMESLRQDPRTYVRAELEVNGRTYTGIGVHLKGSAGSKRSVDDRPAMTLNFDRFQKGQRVFGLEKLHLNNSVQDPSFINDNLASRIYRQAGIPATRATHALVTLNNTDLGFYVVKEAYDQDYLKRHFPQDRGRYGNLYDGGFIRDIDRNLEKDAGNGPDDNSDLKRLREATSSPLAVRRQLFGDALDVDRFLSLMAIQLTLDDWDGYVRNRNNYRVYVQPSGQALFLPSGMDQLLRHPDAPVRDTYAGRVATALMALPKERIQLRDRMRSMSSNVLSETWLLQQVAKIETRLEQASGLVRGPRAFIPDNADNASRIRRRLAVVQRELAAWPDPLPPWPAGRRLVPDESRWNTYVQTGAADCTQTNHPSLGRVFHIRVNERATRATVRAPLALPAGRYRFSGLASTLGVVPLRDDLGIGAGLRLTGATGTQHLEGDADWTTVSYDFELAEDGPVELLFELRADRGEAWFQLGTLTIEAR